MCSYHDVHTAQLRPHLDRHAQDDSLEDAPFRQSREAGCSLFPLEAESFLNLLILGKDFGVVDIAATMEMGKDLNCLLPAFLLR